MKMNYMIIDDVQTRHNYAKYVAEQCDGKHNGSIADFNWPRTSEEVRAANHDQAMQLILSDGIYGFSNQFTSASPFRSVRLTNLNLSEEGWYNLASLMSERNGLVVCFGFGEMTDTIRFMDRAVRRVIEEMDEANINLANRAMGDCFYD
jgi:hypothetical protein